MHELKKNLEDVIEIEGRLITIAKEELSKGKECVDTKEYGEVIDMIKDLASAKKDCLEACYYATVTEAMDDVGEEYERMGYNNRRYSSGRYAPKGRGHISGFTPTVSQMPYVRDYIDDPERFREGMRKMGYSDHRMNRPMDMYRESKRYYHESKDPEAKREMEAHASEHIGETLTSIREIWDDADPKMRMKLKEDISKLVRDMDV